LVSALLSVAVSSSSQQSLPAVNKDENNARIWQRNPSETDSPTVY